MSNFVTYTKQEFEDILTGVSMDMEWELVSGDEDQRCWEYVYEFPTPKPNVGVRIYSTVDKRTGHTRGIGEDAIKVVFWDTKNDRPVGKGKRIHRTEKATSIGTRIEQRVNQFINDAETINVVDFDYVRYVLENSNGNNFAAKLLDSLETYGNLTDNQLAYVLGDKTPKGWDTMEAKCKKANPNFAADFAAINTEDEQEENGGTDPVYPAKDGRNYIAGLVCEVCFAPIYNTHSGVVCDNGHGGVEGVTPTGRNGYSEPEIQNVPPKPKRTLRQPKPGAADEVAKGLAPTHTYPHWEYPFATFNPVQTAVLPHATGDHNLVIGANTSAGKTICAELLMDQVLGRETLNRVIYLSPLKALTQEKYDDWQKRFPDTEITILTGDYTLSETMKTKLANSGIIVMTSEMADSRTRRMQSEKNFWLKEVGLVIVDESHIISTDRGHAVESGLMRFTRINRDARILFLSATMPNCDELAQWLTNLNGHESKVVFSTWRPVALNMNYVGHPIVTNGGGRMDYWATQEAKRSMAIDIVESKPDEKFLVFCHDKNTGRNIVKRLGDRGIMAHFHNADLDLSERLEIEQQFARRDGGLRVLVSTSTLAWGRNLPARNVVIVGVHRGINQVDELDIIQMAGRAGRYGIDDAGFVYLLCPKGTENEWMETFKNPRPVVSHINERATMAFHILAEVENQYIKSVRDLFDWYKRSLAAHQNLKPFEMEDAEGLFTDLKAMEMIEYKGNFVRPTITGLGRVSAWLYFSPYDIHDWYQNFSKLYGPDAKVEADDVTLAWAVGDIDSNDWGYIPADMRTEAEEWQWELRNRGVQASDAVTAAIAAHNCITGQKPKGTVQALQRAMVYDIRRMAQALNLIDTMYAKWDHKEVWDSLPQRIMYGVSEEMVELTKVPGIGGVTARKLYERGIKTIYDITLAENFNTLLKIVPPAKAKAFQRAAAELL